MCIRDSYDNSPKLTTTSSGIDVTGTAIADALNVTGTSVVATLKSTNNNYVMQLQGNNATDKVYIGTTSGNDFIIANTSSVTERLRIDSDGKILQGVTSGVPVCSSANSRLQVHNNASVLTASFTGYGLSLIHI